MTAHYIHDRFVALDKVIDRLAAYEDTGFEPDEIHSLLQTGTGGLYKKLPCTDDPVQIVRTAQKRTIGRKK